MGPAGLSGEGGAVWCLDCGDRYSGRPAQVGDDHGHRDDAHHAARLHAEDHEADFRRFVTAERTREARENSGWTTRVHALVVAASGEDPDSGVWWDGTGYRLIPYGARIDAKGRRVRRRVVELVIAAGFLRQEENGDVLATADGRAMLTIWRHHRADLAEPWAVRHEPQALPRSPAARKPPAAARPPASAPWSWSAGELRPAQLSSVGRNAPSTPRPRNEPPGNGRRPTSGPSASAPSGPVPGGTSNSPGPRWPPAAGP